MSVDQKRNDRVRRERPAAPVSYAGFAGSLLRAAALFKVLAHEGRLKILCFLVDGEMSVTEIERRLGARQAATSQQLARLRTDRLVTARRDGKTVYYALHDAEVRRLVQVICALIGDRDDASPQSR